MADGRPFYLNLLRIRLPIGGWVSILHRVSGTLLALATPSLLYAFMLSLDSPEGYARVAGFFASTPGFLLAIGLVWATLHHFLAGLRHLALDLGWGKDKRPARMSAFACLVLALLLTLAWAVG
ncbi:MAG: succinate dehydrogenase, cytochrome b556 subunit [Thiobacillaceae bacterium]